MIRYPRLLNPRSKKLQAWDLFWSPTGQKIATVFASSAKNAIRQTPKPYSKYKGEIYADISYSTSQYQPTANRGRQRNCGPDSIERDKWIPAHAVRFNKDGSVSMLR